MKHFVVTTAAMLALLVGLTVAAHASRPRFECPERVDMATPPQGEAEIRKLLPPGDAADHPGRLSASIDALRALGISKSQIIDHLIGAYCPVVAQDTSLSDADKTAKIRRYASQITILVYKIENVSEIILNVPMEPTVVDDVNAKARKSGLSVEDWLAIAIETAVEQP